MEAQIPLGGDDDLPVERPLPCGGAEIEGLAAAASIDRVTTRTLLDFLARGDLGLAREVAEHFETEALLALGLDESLGNDAMLFYLLVALLQLPEGQARHRALGISDEISRQTFRDLGVWCLHFRKHARRFGVTLEILEWAQHYLRGELLRIGVLQFEPAEFPDDTPGLARGTPMLAIHIPADARLSIDAWYASGREAFPLFERLKPGFEPRGVFGHGWLLDPQVLALLPGHKELAGLHALATFYPIEQSEAGTIRRLFGPRATRESVTGAPREPMTQLQRAVADFLKVPGNELKGRGAYWLGRP